LTAAPAGDFWAHLPEYATFSLKQRVAAHELAKVTLRVLQTGLSSITHAQPPYPGRNGSSGAALGQAPAKSTGAPAQVAKHGLAYVRLLGVHTGRYSRAQPHGRLPPLLLVGAVVAVAGVVLGALPPVDDRTLFSVAPGLCFVCWCV
jgi:hypothetical protein